MLSKVFYFVAPLALAISGSAALADDEIFATEYLHQTDAGVLELTPGFGGSAGQTAWSNGAPNGIAASSATYQSTTTKTTLGVVPLAVEVEYGINSMFSAGANIVYGAGSTSNNDCPSGATCSTYKYKGFFNPVVYFKGRNSLGAGALLYGIIGDIAIENRKTNSSGDGNFANGGTTLAPFVAYQMPTGTVGAWGIRLQYDLYRGARKSTSDYSTPGQESVQTGGNQWVLDTFYEANVSLLTIGGSLYFESHPDTVTSLNGAPATSNNDGRTLLGFQVYTPVHFKRVTLLPNASYAVFGAYNSALTGVSSLSIAQIGVAARLPF